MDDPPIGPLGGSWTEATKPAAFGRWMSKPSSTSRSTTSKVTLNHDGIGKQSCIQVCVGPAESCGVEAFISGDGKSMLAGNSMERQRTICCQKHSTLLLLMPIIITITIKNRSLSLQLKCSFLMFWPQIAANAGCVTDRQKHSTLLLLMPMHFAS